MKGAIGVLGGTGTYGRAALLSVLLALVCAASAQAATVNVITTSDPTGTGDCTAPTPTTCSLRQAIAAANPNDTVSVPAGTYSLTQGTITIAKNLTITGAGPASTTVDGGANVGGGGSTPNRIFKTTSGTITFGALTLTHGTDGNDENFQSCSPCSTLSGNGGGALFNQGANVSVDNVAFTDNLSSGTPVGGAVANSATLTLTDVSFTNNSAGIGGAFFNHSGTVVGTGVTFDSNGNGTFGGGAMYLAGGTVSFTNMTQTNNGWASSRPGGIENAGAALTLTNDTLAGDIRGSLETDTGGNTTVANTLFASGFSEGSDFACIGSGVQNGTGNTSANAITSESSVGHNLDQDGHCALNADHDQSSVDPHLAPLADNTGPTKTMALLHPSAAIDGGASGSCPANDQRGVSRTTWGSSCDIGAFEAKQLGAPAATTAAASDQTSTTMRFHGTINLAGEAGAYHFIYGTSADGLNQSTPSVGAGVPSGDTAVSADVTGLTPGTTYYFALVAENATGPAATGSTLNQATTAPPPPTITQASSSNITDTQAEIDATINPNGTDTTWEVDYGTQSNNLNHQTTGRDIGSGTSDVADSVQLPGLQAGTMYFYVVKATNSASTPATTGVQSFSTTGGTTSTSTSTTSTSTTTPPPPSRLAAVSGTVSQYNGHLPSTAHDTTPDRDASVRVDLVSGPSRTSRSTRTDAAGNYNVGALPACNPAAGDRCTVSAVGPGGTILDARTVTLPPRISNVRADLIAGRVSDRFVVSGTVLPPGAIASSTPSTAGKPPPLSTDLTISRETTGGKLTEIFDAQKACKAHKWGAVGPKAPACTGTTGGYLLTDVPLPSSKSFGAHDAAAQHEVVTLEEASHPGGPYVAVDSVQITLPADTAENNANPPLTQARALHTVFPVPTHAGGHTVGGRVTELRPFMPRPSALAAQGASRATVSIVDTNGHAVAHTHTDRAGYYAFTDLKSCSGKSGRRCTVEVTGTTSTDVEDRQRFTLPSLSPSVTVVDLSSGRVANRFFVRGKVTPPDVKGSPATNLTISLPGKSGTQTQIYDAQKTCSHGGWGPTVGKGQCSSTLGSYLLDAVPIAGKAFGKSGKPHHALLTLSERTTGGKWVPVDSVSIKLPADTKKTNGNPPIIAAPDLRAVFPVPASARGRTLTGQTLRFMPALPGSLRPLAPEAGVKVTVTAIAGKQRVRKTTTSDRRGVYSVTDLPACDPAKGDTCTVAAIARGGGIADQHTFHLTRRTPSTTSQELDVGLIPAAPIVVGSIASPGTSPLPTTDLQISVTRGGVTTVVYDALKECARGGWLPAPGTTTGPASCRSGFGGYALGSVPSAETVQKGATGPVRATLTLLERGRTSALVPVDSTEIELPLTHGVSDANGLIVKAATLQG